ncbi:uncharacterized protein F5147DRAFT_216204 [Suillus discolor]|uniref:Uncharacterized protein n=1 Tax=Suillus discolor TaxID=1912936 RepID=A0A9P7JT71_9AGAM|nr:uncharacterized protein F5147DRAFT_216204 [Suillus discolor]KAG2106928.1 hypothetical protein F5147DRAFT_216204 [Suillus discolor]
MAASPGIPLDTAVIMSSVLEGILYGFSVLMFLGTIWIITYKCRTRNINRPAVVVATLLFLLSTVHMVVGIIRVEDGLVKYRDTFPGGPAAFFADISEETLAVKDAILVLQTLLGDGVVIYRCYIVWQSVWIIIIPCMTWCGIAAFGVVTLYDFSQASSNNVFTNKIGHSVATFMALTLATNLLSSGLLAYRIWKSERKVSGIRATDRKMPLLRVFLDAAILYSAALCSSIICFVLSNNGLYVMADLNVPIISIAFYMVFIRMTINQHNRDYISTVLGGGSGLEHRNSQQYPMQSLHDIYRQNDTTSFLADNSKAHTLA